MLPPDAAAAAAQILYLLLNLIPCCSRGKCACVCVCVVCIHVCGGAGSCGTCVCCSVVFVCVCVWQGNKMKVCVVDFLHCQSVSIICFVYMSV